MNQAKPLVFALCALLAPPAETRELKCYRDPLTDAVHCVDVHAVSQRGALRLAPLYRGGPDKVRRTSSRLAVDCAAGVAHLKDDDGASYGAGPVTSTPLLSALAGYVCSARISSR